MKKAFEKSRYNGSCCAIVFTHDREVSLHIRRTRAYGGIRGRGGFSGRRAQRLRPSLAVVYDGAMRNRLGAIALVFSIATASTALADVGPAPSCPSGTYSAYLMGRRCVKNGYRLVQDEKGNVIEARDEPTVSPSAAPVDTGPAVTPAPVTPAATPAAAPVQPKSDKAAACAMTTRGGSGVELLTLAAALALTLLSRRRATSRASS
jgi:hypothetical protein